MVYLETQGPVGDFLFGGFGAGTFGGSLVLPVGDGPRAGYVGAKRTCGADANRYQFSRLA